MNEAVSNPISAKTKSPSGEEKGGLPLFSPVAGGLLLLLVLVWLVYSPAKDFTLLSWDDDLNLQENPHLTGFSAESLHWMFFDLTYQWRYQPLAWVSSRLTD